MGRSVRKQAAEWFVEFRTSQPSERIRKAFLAWLKESPAHMAAYLEMASLWEQSAVLETQTRWSLEVLLREAKSDEQKVVALDLGDGRAVADPAHRRHLWMQAVGIAASLLIILGVAAGGWLYWDRNTYATTFGEQRSIVLSDGSTVELNARSRIRIRFSDR